MFGSLCERGSVMGCEREQGEAYESPTARDGREVESERREEVEARR